MTASLNKVQIIGYLGKDPETRAFAGGGKVVTFSVATGESWKDSASGERKERTQWHSVAIYNEGLGKIAAEHLRMGSRVYLEGQLEYRQYEKDGFKHTATEIALRPYHGQMQMLDNTARRPDEGKRAAGSQSRVDHG